MCVIKIYKFKYERFNILTKVPERLLINENKRTSVRFYYLFLGLDDIDIILFHSPDEGITGNP
jgi:hypothetical protein